MAGRGPGRWHRRIWQRLPRSLRRRVLFRVADVMAPRIDRGRPLAAPLIVVGALKTASGLGQSARLCHDALKALGLPVYGIDVGAALMQPDDGVAFTYADGRDVIGAGTLIFHVNAPLMALAMLALPRGLMRLKRVVGYWAWELPALPDDWMAGFKRVDEIWVPSRFTADAVKAHAGNLPVHVVAHPVALDAATPPQPRRRRSSSDPFNALVIFNMGSSFARKNPLAAIEAFKQAFGDDPTCRLTVKCANMKTYPEGAERLRVACRGAANIVLRQDVMSAIALAALYREADVVMSLHRSEGFALVIAEAMVMGLPVIATDWSGNVDFLSADTGVPIGYDLVPARDAQATYDFSQMMWADARVPDAAAALQRLRADPDGARVMGQRAQAFAKEAFGANCYAAVLAPLLTSGRQA